MNTNRYWRETALTVLTLLAIVAGAVYLVLRATTLGDGWLLGLSVPFFLAELTAYAQFSLFAFVAWHSHRGVPDRTNGPPRRRTSSRAVLTDLVIDVRGQRVEQLERTLVGARNVHSAGAVFVIDDQHRDEMANTTRALNARYVSISDAGDRWIETMFDVTTSDHVAWLLAGQVPMPDFVEAGSGRLADQKVAVWQSAVGLFNSDSFTHVQRGRDEMAVVRSIINPGLDLFGAAPWSGPGSIMRRSAFDTSLLPETSSSSAARRLVDLHRTGWTSATDSTTHVRAIAPNDLDDYLALRRTRAASAFDLVFSRSNPLIRSGLSPLQRVAHLMMASPFMTGLRQAVVVAVAIGTLLAGRLPFVGNLGPVLACWALATVTSTAARRLLAGDSMRLGDWTKHGWRTLGADATALAGVLRPAPHEAAQTENAATGLRSLGQLRLLTAIVIALDLALLARGATLIFESALPAFTVSERLIAISWGVFALVPMVDVLHLVVARRQRRKSFRLAADLNITIGDVAARTIDLSTSGVGVLLPFAPAIDSKVELRLDLPTDDGSLDAVDIDGIVRAANRDDSGQVRVGIEFDDVAPRARQSLIRFCMTDVSQPERPSEVAEPHTLTIDRQTEGRAHPVRALTAVASMASLALLFFGPSSASAAVAAPETFAVTVLSSSGAGLPGAEVRIFVDEDERWVSVGTTAADGVVSFDESPDVLARTNATIEIVWNGSRRVLPLRTVETVLSASRVDVSGTDVEAIDVGSGWEPLSSSVDVLPGKIAIRLGDGVVRKIDLAPGNVYLVASDDQRTVEPGDANDSPETTQPTTTTTELSPGDSSTTSTPVTTSVPSTTSSSTPTTVAAADEVDPTDETTTTTPTASTKPPAPDASSTTTTTSVAPTTTTVATTTTTEGGDS